MLSDGMEAEVFISLSLLLLAPPMDDGRRSLPRRILSFEYLRPRTETVQSLGTINQKARPMEIQEDGRCR